MNCSCPDQPCPIDHEATRAINTLLAVTDPSPPCWWWLSFVDTDTDTFLGVAVVEAPNYYMASQEAWARDCNPGGQMEAWPIPDEELPAEEWRNRLLTKAEAMECQS